MQFVDAIEQSISLFVLPAAPPAATQRKSWRWPESLLWTAESELREDATTGSMLFNAHSFSDDHCGRYITRRLCLARARPRRGPSRICSCMPGPSPRTACPSSRRLTRACSIVLRGRCRDQSAGWSGAAWSGAPCPVTTGSAGRRRRPSRPPALPPGAASCRGAPRLALQRHF
jgi:hypothetical protein